MKRILYYTARDMTNPTEGITKKIWNQIHALESYGFQVDAVYRKNDEDLVIWKNGNEKLIKRKMKRPFKVEASRFLRIYLKKHRYDGIYVRYVYDDLQFHRLLKHLKNAGTKIQIEIPTYPYDEELKDNLENKIVLFLDRAFRNKMKKYVDQIAVVSQDREVFGIPAVELKNGVNFDEIGLAVRNEKLKDCINIIAVAGFAKWHAFDRMICGMGEYYQAGGNRKICLHMVGDGAEMPLYQELAAKYGLGQKVKFYGFQSGARLEEIYSTADIALSSLGIHRIGLKTAQTLKSKEYGAKGLPIISEYLVEEYPKGEAYQLVVPMDESPIDMEAVIRMYDAIEAENIEQERQTIRSAVQAEADIRAVMKPAADFYRSF